MPGPILSNGPQSTHQLTRGPIVDQNCMLAGIVILLNQKVYFVNVYARMSLNRLFSDTIYQLMWETKKSENILMCVRYPSVPPWTRPRYLYVLRSGAEGTTFRFKNEHKKQKQNAITMNNNNESKIFRYKDCWVCDRTSHQSKVILRRGHGLIRETGALLM